MMSDKIPLAVFFIGWFRGKKIACVNIFHYVYSLHNQAIWSLYYPFSGDGELKIFLYTEVCGRCMCSTVYILGDQSAVN
jgi:hypothetical protein